MADGGICATLRDVARFGQLFLQRGQLAGRDIVPESWIEDIVRGAPDGASAFRGGDNPAGYPAGAHYRNCWWVRDPSVPLYHASGINGQHVFVHVPAQTVVAKLSTWSAALSADLLKLTVTGVMAAATALHEGRC